MMPISTRQPKQRWDRRVIDHPLLMPLLLILLAIPASWPLLTVGLPGTADGHLHLLRMVLLDHHIGQGMFYPRWVPELVLGYGYPVFHYYGPSSYYLALLFHWLGLSYVQALIAAFIVLINGAGLGMYQLARERFADQGAERRRWLALVAAVAYLYSPYLLTNVYMRGAIAEVGAQALLPWIIWSFRRLLTAQQPARYLLPAALTLGCLAITHTITLIFAPPLLLLYLVVVWLTNPQSRQAARRHLWWGIAGGVAAMGVSCFFWVPLLIERAFLADTAYEIAAIFIHENVWSWGNFLDGHWPFEYTLAIPFQLGALQLLLALGGFVALRKRDGEWWYWAILIPALGVAISQPALPIWLSSATLLTAQFPWRLLSLMSLPLALLVPPLLGWLRRTPWLIAGALLLSVLIVSGNRPQLAPEAELFPSEAALSLPAVAQFELDAGAYGTGSASEYMPRWVEVLDTGVAPPVPEITAGQQFTLTAANAYQWQLAVDQPAPVDLRFTRFYFPGWAATLDGTQPLATQPSTLMGLLTTPLPAGEHTLAMRWTGTTLQWWSAMVSLLTLALLSVLALRQRGRVRFYALLPVGLLLFGSVATFKPLPTPTAYQQPPTRTTVPGLQLLGYYTQQTVANQLYLFPFWAVGEAPQPLLLHWRLTDQAQQVVSEVTVLPYFNTRPTTAWPPNAIAQDAYLLPLPGGLAAGEYSLQLGFATLPAGSDHSAEAEQPLVTVGKITLDKVPLQHTTPTYPLVAQWEGGLQIDGYDVQVDGQDQAGPATDGALMQEAYLWVKPGSRLTYTFYWRAEQPPLENYHGFLHLLDVQQRALVQRDQLPGPMFSPPRLWNRFVPQPDSYAFTIPADAPSGLYTPHLGLYHYGNGERLATRNPDGTTVGTSVSLPPVKVVAPVEARPQQELAVKVGDFAELIGYDLALPTAVEAAAPASIHAGDAFTVTLYYRATGSAPTAYTQFVHLHDPSLGMAAQFDQMPQGGGNPTSAWAPGEIIVDQVLLQIPPTQAPGTYNLQVGLYDALNGATRVPLVNAQGEALIDAQLLLTTIVIAPCTGHC